MIGYKCFEPGKKYVFSHRKYQKYMGFKMPNEKDLAKIKGIVFTAKHEIGSACIRGKLIIVEWCTKLD